MRKIIGICVARMQDDANQKQVSSICRQAEKQQFDVLLFNVFSKLDYMDSFSKGEITIFERIPFHKLSALVIFSESFLNPSVAAKLAESAHQAGLPVLSIDSRIEGCFNLLFDYEEAFERIVRHIVEYHGCRKINFMAGFEDNDFSDARINVFKKVLMENQIVFEPDRLAYGQFWEIPARKNCEKWVQMWKDGTQEMPEAIICANDIMALTVLNVLTNHGIRIPEDIYLTGFDGLELEQYCTPRLTSTCDETEALGIQALKIIETCIAAKETKPYDLRIPFQIKFSESCGCEPKAPCNPNEQIMFLYGRSAEMRIRSNDTFMMMPALTDDYSVRDMAKKLKQYQHMMTVDSMMIFLNRNFYSVTDVSGDTFEEHSMLLLAQIRDGKYTTPLKEIKPYSEYEALKWMLKKDSQVIFFPLHCQEEVYGFMAISYRDANKDIGAFLEFVLGFDQVLGTIRRQSLLHKMHITDILTDLYNRRGFYNLLSQKMDKLARKRKLLFLASVDMDGLKFINDTFGHAEGDYALKVVAKLLRESMEGHDGICARFGGDEYMLAVITAEQDADIAFYEQYEERLYNRFHAFSQKSQKPYEIGVSAGTVYGIVTGPEDIDVLMKKADNMMYDCKCGHHASRTARFRDSNRQ